MVCAIQICCLCEHTHALTHIRLRTWGNKKTYVHTSYKQIYIYIIWPLLFFFILAWFSCPLCRFLFRTIATIHVYKNPVTTITTTCNVLYVLCFSTWEVYSTWSTWYVYIRNIHMNTKMEIMKVHNPKIANLHQICIKTLVDIHIKIVFGFGIFMKLNFVSCS